MLKLCRRPVTLIGVVVIASALALATVAAHETDALSLSDTPVMGTGHVSLNGQWTAYAQAVDLSINATVPGDLISDLERAGVIGNPLYELNFLNSSIWNDHAWSYSRPFTYKAPLEYTAQQLVFDGIKMGANISLNGHFLGQATDQFLRYKFNVSDILVSGANIVTVTFDPTINVLGRFMACTGGWDWAPYSQTHNYEAFSFSKGIWKDVYIVETASVFVDHFVPHVFYNGSYPAAPLTAHNHGDFEVRVKVFYESPRVQPMSFVVGSEWGESKVLTQQAQPGENVFETSLIARASEIDLWWTWELGAQPLYNVSVIVSTQDFNINLQKRVGFRVFSLVTGNDTDPAYVKKHVNTDGTDTQGMLFRINGAAIFARGANMIPMEEMEGRLNADAHYQLVKNARGGGMNILRVWGGGIFLPSVWYDACDENGIIVYHDMQYAQLGHSPANVSTQALEFRHQIRRLSAHPSIVIWDGCNECVVRLNTPTGIYATFVLKVVQEEDMSRVLWPSCPAMGWVAGVNRLTGLPNGSPKGLLPRDPASLEFSADGGKAFQYPYDHHTVSEASLSLVPASAAKSTNGGRRTLSEEGAASASCTFLPNTDIDAGPVWIEPAASSKENCCDLCSNDQRCYVAVFYDGVCYFKNDTNSPIFRQDRWACLPAGVGPLPPPTPSPPPPPTLIETHGPYQHGSGFPSVNGPNNLNPFDPNIPISLKPMKTGPEYYNVFASEFGCVVMSSFESMSPTIDPQHWSLHGGAPPDVCAGTVCNGTNVMAQRNYVCDSIVYAYFGASQPLDAVGEAAFKKQLFQCMLGQALEMKSNIETRRGTNQFGIMIWQLNEIWPTGGWGSIEYGTPDQPGQVLGGRWKPLHYFLRKSVFADVMAACDGRGVCYLKNDIAKPFKGSVSIRNVPFNGDPPTLVLQQSFTLRAGAGVTEWFSINMTGVGLNSSVLVIDVVDSSGAVASSNVQALSIPGNMALLPAFVRFEVAQTANADGSIDITVATDNVAMYVTLTTLEHGRFSDNAFLLEAQASKVISFIPFLPTSVYALEQSLRIEHLAQYL